MEKRIASVQWTKLNEYKAYQEKRKNALNRFKERVEAAREQVAAAESEYTTYLYREVSEDADFSKEKNEALEKLAKGKEELQRAEAELAKATAIQNGLPQAITREQLLTSWNGEYKQQVRSEVVEPALDAFRLARANYLNAVLNVLNIDKEASQVWNYNLDEYMKDIRIDRAYQLPASLFSMNEVPLIDNTDLFNIQAERKLDERDAAVLEAATKPKGRK